ncbi:hypothetical protein, partial [Streptomyces anulatus]|uniref:hypothetical protein n=1 Tax=Streptomyces anulatus TaxID=1892 RepID=UPI00343CF0CA
LAGLFGPMFVTPLPTSEVQEQALNLFFIQNPGRMPWPGIDDRVMIYPPIADCHCGRQVWSL